MKIHQFSPYLAELARSEKLSQGQKTLLKKSIRNLCRGIKTKKRKIVAKEVDKISKILLELIS